MHFRTLPRYFGHYVDGKLFERKKKKKKSHLPICSSCNYPFLACLLLFLIRTIRIIMTDSTHVLIILSMYTSSCLCERLKYVNLLNALRHRLCQTFINGLLQLPKLQLTANVCDVQKQSLFILLMVISLFRNLK